MFSSWCREAIFHMKEKCFQEEKGGHSTFPASAIFKYLSSSKLSLSAKVAVWGWHFLTTLQNPDVIPELQLSSSNHVSKTNRIVEVLFLTVLSYWTNTSYHLPMFLDVRVGEMFKPL